MVLLQFAIDALKERALAYRDLGRDRSFYFFNLLYAHDTDVCKSVPAKHLRDILRIEEHRHRAGGLFTGGASFLK